MNRLGKKTHEFVATPIVRLWTRCVATGVLAEAKVRSEQQAGKASTRQVMVKKTNEFDDKLVDEAKILSEQQAATS